MIFRTELIANASMYSQQTTSPACTELEIVMMDWLAKAMDLPSDLLNGSNSEGGGCIQVNMYLVSLVIGYCKLNYQYILLNSLNNL